MEKIIYITEEDDGAGSEPYLLASASLDDTSDGKVGIYELKVIKTKVTKSELK